MMPSLMTLFSLLQEARMAAKLLEKKFGIKDVSRREKYKHNLDQINHISGWHSGLNLLLLNNHHFDQIHYQGGTLDEINGH